jgi:putative transposase
LLFAEAKWVRNSLIAQLNSGRKINEFSYKDFKSVVHYDKDKNEIVSEVKQLRTSMRDEVVIEVKNNIRALNALKKIRKTVGRLKFESDHKRIHLRQYRVTHEITSQNTIRIQGLSHEVRVAGLRQLRTLDKAGIEYEITTADIIKKDDDFYVNITVFVDKDVWNAYQENKRNKRNAKRKDLKIHDINALDMGCLKTVTDAYGRVYNSTVEETERLKRLQRKLQRQKKGSNNRKNTLKQLHREYEKNDNLKEQKAIELVNEVLDTTRKLII